MLYDPKWEKQAETKADPLSLEALIAWLEKQPASIEYDYTDPRDCLLCRYFKAHGYSNPAISGAEMDHDGGHTYFPDIFRKIANDSLDGENYGAALKRARKLTNV